MVMMQRLALLLVLVFMPAGLGLPDEAVGRVVSVISGDSLGIEMLIADARTNNVDSIKLADIEAPSTVTAEGKAAQRYAHSLLKNKTVYLDINDNTSGTRNEWSQLICVVYLMDSDFRPVWPPVNRMLVDGGHARLNDDVNNEFNSSAWWQGPPAFPPGKKRDLLKAMLSGAKMEDIKKGSILEKDSASGQMSIGYRT
jgi:endonuclease YncB( thermonuclease family)